MRGGALSLIGDCGIRHAAPGTLPLGVLRNALAALLGRTSGKVRCIHLEGAVCHGQNGVEGSPAAGSERFPLMGQGPAVR